MDSLQTTILKSGGKDGWDIAAIIFNALTLLGLVASLWMSWRLQEAAQKQTATAQEALKEARRQNQLAIRPIVLLEPDPTYERKGDVAPARLRFRNIGKGPAFHITAIGKAGEDVVIAILNIPLVEEAQHCPATFIPVKAVRDHQAGFQTVQPLFEWMRDGLLPSPIRLTIFYKDVYEALHETAMHIGYETARKPRWELKFSRLRVNGEPKAGDS